MLKIQQHKNNYKENYFFRTKDLLVKNDSFRIYTFFESEYKNHFGSFSGQDSSFYNLFQVQEGEFDCVTSLGQKYTLGKGGIVLSAQRKGSSYHTGGSGYCKRKCFLIFKTEFTRKLLSCFFPGEEFYIFSPPEETGAFIQKLQEEFCGEHSGNDSGHLLGLFTELLELLRNSLQEKKLPEEFLKILSFVEQNLYDPALKREDIAANSSVSTSTLDRLFRKYMNKSVSEYILEKRFCKVESLLAIPGIRIKEISDSSGFSSSIHMNFLFRKRYGTTPSRYRKKLLLSNSPYLQTY